MEIGKRLRELRVAKHLSQGGIENRTGLMRSYVSRVEGGYAIPKLETLERFAAALGVELYQLFYSGHGKPMAPKVPGQESLTRGEQKLVDMFRQMSPSDRKMVLTIARRASRRQR